MFVLQGLKSVNVRRNSALHMHSDMSQVELENLYLSYAVATDGLERNHTLDVFEVSFLPGHSLSSLLRSFFDMRFVPLSKLSYRSADVAAADGKHGPHVWRFCA